MGSVKQLSIRNLMVGSPLALEISPERIQLNTLECSLQILAFFQHMSTIC